MKRFNIMVGRVVRAWLLTLRDEMDLEGKELGEIIETLFAIFYVDNACIVARDLAILQQAINDLVTTFERVGLETNTNKTQTMTCTPSKIRFQLLAESYQQMHTGRTPAADWVPAQSPAENVQKTCGQPLLDATPCQSS